MESDPMSYAESFDVPHVLWWTIGFFALTLIMWIFTSWMALRRKDD